jgi:hypothetical protein
MRQLLALAALVGGVGLALAAPAPAALRVAVLSDDLPGLDRALVEHVRGQVAATGAAVTLLSGPQLADPAVFDRTRQDVLILTHSPVFPGAARDNMQRFLEAGGHLVLMGGFAYERPMCRVQGAWRDQAAFARLLAELPAQETFFAFEDTALGRWQRGTNKPEHPSQASLVPGPAGRALRLDIRDVGPWQWDVWSTNLPAPPAAGSDLLLLRARAGARTPEVYVEVDEVDGARWVLRAPLTTRWARYALETGRFKFLKDSSPPTRGGPGDRLDLSRARRLSLGLASGKDDVPAGDHWLEVDEIGVARNTLGASAADFRAPNTVCFDTYEPYVLRGIQRVTPVGITPPPPLTMPLSGLSAVGFTLWDRSELVPLLQVHDRQGRPRGWAASQLIHYGGPYQGGCWLLSGITTPGFYRTPTFDRTLTQFLKKVAGGRLPEEAAGRNEREKQRTLGKPQTAPEGLTISPDGHFVYPDGRRFFMVGADYIGSLDRKFFGGPWLAWLERDFQAASQAGINCLRVYGASALYRDPVKLAALKDLARRFNLRLLIVVVDHTNLLTREELQARAREVATAFADEPMLLGYDLQNEPYLYEVAKVKDGPQTLGEKYPLWQRWGEYEKSANLGGSEHFTSFPGVSGPLAPSAEWAPVVQDASSVFGDWIRWQVEAIRSVDRTHPITVGYNSVFATLPCNAQLDFISHHGYEKPVDLAAVERNLTTMDRLHALWPGKPVSFGEFGYTNGMVLNGRYLDLHTSALGEFLHYLYAWNQGYEGCMKWVLMDHPLELSRQQCSWIPPDDLGKHVDQGRYGLFYSAGTATPQPKPLAGALFFLRRHMTPGAKRGELRLVKADNALGTGYVYRAPDALFIGNTTYSSADLSFTAKTPANVLLHWGPGLDLVSTADATVRLKPDRFRKGLSGKVSGHAAWVRRQGDWVELALLEGQPVRFGE